jgi:hypothetical protein
MSSDAFAISFPGRFTIFFPEGILLLVRAARGRREEVKRLGLKGGGWRPVAERQNENGKLGLPLYI